MPATAPASTAAVPPVAPHAGTATAATTTNTTSPTTPLTSEAWGRSRSADTCTARALIGAMTTMASAGPNTVVVAVLATEDGGDESMQQQRAEKAGRSEHDEHHTGQAAQGRLGVLHAGRSAWSAACGSETVNACSTAAFTPRTPVAGAA